jgi:hypothetical protein
LNVRQVEQLIRTHKNSPRKTKNSGGSSQDPNVRVAQNRLQEYFGTKVHIGPGKIEIYYENPDDLIRIFDLIL